MSLHPAAVTTATAVTQAAHDGGMQFNLSGDAGCAGCLALMFPPAAVVYGGYRLVRRYLPHRQPPLRLVWRQKPQTLPPGLRGVHEADPSFSEPGFIADALAIYLAVYRARVECDYRPLRPLLTSSLLDAEQTRQTERAARGHRRQLPIVERMTIVDARAMDSGDVITVSIEGRRGSTHHASRQRFMKQWVFERDAAARRTVPALPDRCNVCGAQLDLGPEGRCRYCDALLPSPSTWHVTAMRDLD